MHGQQWQHFPSFPWPSSSQALANTDLYFVQQLGCFLLQSPVKVEIPWKFTPRCKFILPNYWFLLTAATFVYILKWRVSQFLFVCQKLLFSKRKRFFPFCFIFTSKHIATTSCLLTAAFFLCSLHVLFSYQNALVIPVFELILKTEEVFVCKYHFVFTFPSPVFPAFLVQLFYTPSYSLLSSSKVGNVVFNKLNNEPGLQRDVPVPYMTSRSLPGVGKVGRLGTCVLKWFSKHRNAAEGKKIRAKADWLFNY